MDARSLTPLERDQLIEAGLDPVYCEIPDDGKPEIVRNRLFERKMNKWIADNIYHLDLTTITDFEMSDLCRKTIRLTVVGEEEAVKNS